MGPIVPKKACVKRKKKKKKEGNDAYSQRPFSPLAAGRRASIYRELSQPKVNQGSPTAETEDIYSPAQTSTIMTTGLCPFQEHHKAFSQNSW